MFVCALISSILAHELTSGPLTAVAEGGSTAGHTNAPLCCRLHLPLLFCPNIQKTMAPSKPTFTAGLDRGEAGVGRKAGAKGRGQEEEAGVRGAERRCSESEYSNLSLGFVHCSRAFQKTPRMPSFILHNAICCYSKTDENLERPNLKQRSRISPCCVGKNCLSGNRCKKLMCLCANNWET